MSRSSRRVCPLVLFFTFIASLAGAQSGTGRISGIVKDATGAVVPGVTITATHEPTGIKHEIVTNDSGLFLFPSLSPGPYTVRAELSGFKPVSNVKNLLTVGADLNVTIRLEPGDIREAIVVTAESPIVQTTESSLSTLVSKEIIVTLPLNGRNPLHLIGLVPGVTGHSAEATSSGGTSTHYINGDRGRGITTTQDGIDISDPVIPRGELTNAPVNPEALQEFRVITSNAKAEYGRSAGGQVELVTRSGTNKVGGTLYEFFRDTALDSNSYFNKLRGLPKEVLRRNQFGAAVGGPIVRDRAFFFVNYDGQRRRQDTSQLVTVPTQSLRNGVFRFVTQACAGSTTARNLASCVDRSGNPLVPVSSYSYVANDPRALGLDPVMQQETLKFLPLPNDFTVGDGLNTAGYRWNSPSVAPVDALTTRVDYTVNKAQSLFARYSQAFRNDLINDIINTTPRPLSWPARVRLSDQQGAAVGHKWTLSPHLVNEITGGYTRNVLAFADPQHPGTYELRPSVFSVPFVYWAGTGREPTELQFLDNLTWIQGTHAFKAGVNVRKYYISQTRGAGNPFGIYPALTFNRLDATFSGFDTASSVMRGDGSTVSLTSSGINATDRNNLNTLYNVLLGRIGRIDQSFYSNGQAFVALQPLTLDQRVSEYNFYVQDDWRLRSNLTVNAGLRYELNSVPYDAAGVQVVPDRPLDGSQGPVTFLQGGPGTGRDWFKRDNNNFAPSLGIAWDPTGSGRTSVRASYRVAYQRLITWALNVVEQRQPATSLNQFIVAPRDTAIPGTDQVLRLSEFLKQGRLPNPQGTTTVSLANGVPALNTPASIVRTPPNLRNEQPLFFDPNMRTPYVQQFIAGVQRELWKGTVLEVSYVGSRGSKLFRMMNVNTMDLVSNGFIRDFQAARRNLVASGNANTGEPTGNFGRLFSGGTIPSSLFADIQNNNVGLIADVLDRGTQGIGLAAAGLPNTFFRPNPQFSIAGLGCTCSSSEYNALQIQVQKRLSAGLAFAANYTLAKSTDDVSNDTRGAGTELVVPSDPKRLHLDKSRSDFDVRHVARGHAIWDLPFGRDRKLLSNASGLVNALVGGWQVNGILDVSSGFPFSVHSGFHTFTFYDSGTRVATTSGNGTTNRAVYTGPGSIGAVRETATGVEFLNADERAMFRTPEAGETGSSRNLFTGPGYFQVDLGIFKSFPIRGHKLELRTEIFNVFNTVNFADPNTLASSANFGQITDTRVPPRIVQLGVKYYF